MKGDFSRQTFDPTKHYNSVLMQQGRVQLDADWNEQQAIHQHRVETETQDVIGLSGAPIDHAGFEIRLNASHSGKLTIGVGRYYLDGLLCENETDVSYDEQRDFPDAPEVLEALKVKGTHTAIVYLDAWKRHVTALDDPAMLEPALGGPDTTTRVKTIWQVKVLPVKEPESQVVGCGSFFQEWEELVTSSTGGLRAMSQPAATVSNPCILPSSAGYRGLENQLYRVEIHKGGTLGGEPAKTPTFKWSRDNGTVVTRIERINGQEVTVRDLGPDEVLSFASGQWVEIIDDTAELAGRHGQLLQIDSVNRVSRVIKLATAPTPLSSGGSGIEPKYNPKLRRWDSAGELPVKVPGTDGGFITLEDGIQVKFDGPTDRPLTYRTGDYWLIPARTVTTGESGSFAWPAARIPAGIQHRYERLAVLRSDAEHKNLMVMQDCRRFFSPLTMAPALHVMGVNWQNDDIVPLEQLRTQGLEITLDGIPLQQTAEAPKVPQSVSPATFIVTVETSTSGAADSTVTTPGIEVILNGTITVQNNILSWKPATDEFTKLLVGPPLHRLVRVRLKGSTIWAMDLAGQPLFLDGQAFGRVGVRSVGEIPRTDLMLPSGSGARASDFESWFILEAQVPPPPDLESFTVTPATIRAGQPVTATITLTGPAPKEPMPITLTKTLIKGRDGVTALPGTVTVPEGQRVHTFTFQTAADQGGVISLKSTLRGSEKTVTLTTQVVSVTINPKAITVFTGAKVPFAASVQGSLGEQGVKFTVEPGAGNVGVIVSTGPTTATYTASNVVGTYSVVATSVEDQTKFEKAIVTVVQKPKESKEAVKDRKEAKENIKDRKEALIEGDKRIRDRIDITRKLQMSETGPKVLAEKVTDRAGGMIPDIRGAVKGSMQGDEQNKATSKRKPMRPKGSGSKGRAFIRSEERPPVGEPKGKIKKPTRKKPRRTGKK